MKRSAVLLMGPTGAGKTDLGLELVAALPLEIVSVDSALIYRGMNIGTAKPSADILARVPHHLVDLLDPAQSYSAGDFVRDALRAMNDIWARGRQPLLVGGTMMYFHALTQGIADLPTGDPAVRLQIEAEAAQLGWPALHRILAQVDPAAALRIQPTDPQRIQRALEVYRLTGTTITALQRASQSLLVDVDVCEFVLAPPQRADLHVALERRFQRMLDAGFLDEVRALRDRGDLTLAHPSMRCVGYRQLWRHLEGEDSLADATHKGVIATRQLAKRQWTWLRRRSQAQWLDPAHPNVAQTVIIALSKRSAESS